MEIVEWNIYSVESPGISRNDWGVVPELQEPREAVKETAGLISNWICWRSSQRIVQDLLPVLQLMMDECDFGQSGELRPSQKLGVATGNICNIVQASTWK